MLFYTVSALCVPLAGGLFEAFFRPKNTVLRNAVTLVSTLYPLLAGILLLLGGETGNRVLFSMTQELRVVARVDRIGLFFSLLFSAVYLLATLFGLAYFKGDENKPLFDGFWLLSFGALQGLCFSGNLLTMYLMFESVTLLSMPMVLHEKTAESVNAALKYLFYSVGGAFLGFIGVVYFGINTASDEFLPGGSLLPGTADSPLFQAILLLTVIGFGAKCGLFPLHNWLPTAHPVAPAPASAILSAVITKSGIIAVIRIIYDTVGTEAIRGTMFQKIWLVLILTTILLGSMMALIQKNFKRRLAFSTVSQVSYVLLGIALLNEDALTGSLLQIVSHAVVKTGLFLTAGVIIRLLGKHDVDELSGIGKQIPVTVWCYTVCSLGLVGVPPTGGFAAKWYLAQGALESGLGGFSVAAPVILILSAILTAAYLLTVTVQAFFPSDSSVSLPKVKEPLLMTVPLILLAVLSVATGLFADFLLAFSPSFLL